MCLPDSDTVFTKADACSNQRVDGGGGARRMLLQPLKVAFSNV